MKNAMLKNAFAEMKKTKSRFFSIFGIIAIGTGFFAGLLASAPAMKKSSDNYYDRTSLLDYRLVSTYGFDDNDIKALKDGLSNVNVYPGYYTDAYVNTDSGEKKVARVYSLDTIGENNPYSSLEITEGRLPQAENECVVDNSKMVKEYKVGDKLTLGGDENTDIDETLSVKEFTIVGRFESPMYISDVERGNTTIGSGSVFMLCYVPQSCFKTEVYTQVVITSDKLKEYNCYSDEYENARDELGERIQKIADSREQGRYDEIIKEAQSKIDDGQKELDEKKADAYKEIDDNEKKLDDAKKELDDAKVQLADGKAQLDDSKKQLDDAKKQLDENEPVLADSKKQLDDSKKQLDDSKKLLDDTKVQLDSSKAQLDSSAKQLDDTKAQLDSAKTQLDETSSQLDTAKTQLDSAKAQLDESKATLDATDKQLTDSQNDINNSRVQINTAVAVGMMTSEEAAVKLAQLDAAQQQVDAGRAQYESGLAQYNAGLSEYEKSKAEYDAGYAQYSAAKAQYESGLAQYNDGRAQYESGLSQYNEGKKQYEEGLAQYNEGKKQYEDGLAKYEKGKAEYDNGRKQYEDGLAKYNDGVEEYEKNYAAYEDGLKEYNDVVKELSAAKAEADEKFADAQKEIDDNQKKLDDVEKPEWYLFTRDDDPGYSEYGQNAERISNIAMVFPLFFVMVAALVCLTTMTRMVEEQRTQIGTLKALGYKNGAIMFKYMFYALTAGIAGAVIGMLVGMKIFPAIIITAYGMMYVIPDILLPYDFALMAGTTAAAVLLTAVTVYFSCSSILHDCPATLMRPKTPKSGKKILLERIGFIWNRLSFSHKVTMRNIFRYKRRMLMTIVGIAGCTALVLTGFGVYDSVNDIIEKQFGEISNYTGIAAYGDTETDEQITEISDKLAQYNCDGNKIYQKQITVSSGKNSTDAYIFGAKDNDTIAQFVTVKDRRTGERYTVTDEGVIINEKLATLLGGVKKGDEITLSLSDTKRVNAKVTEICENYAHHYVYITEKLYKELSNEDALPYNCYFFNSVQGDDMPESDRDKLAEKLMKIDGVMGVSFKTSVEGTFSTMLKSLLLVIVVLIVSAGALAFIVLYNLTNININERIREIASLKVLGFYDKEVSMYVFRETVILTLIGTLAGMIFGRFLVDFVVRTAEIDMVMFGRTVHPMSFALSAVITIFFAVTVMLFMHKRLMKVDMVEALKSVE